MPDAYEIYFQWCRDHGEPVPSREWWDNHLKKIDVEFEPDFDYGQERKHWGDDWS